LVYLKCSIDAGKFMCINITHLAGFALMTRMLMSVGAGRVAMALEGG
jgi:hypothetical protein